jgi:hypothetical protein
MKSVFLWLASPMRLWRTHMLSPRSLEDSLEPLNLIEKPWQRLPVQLAPVEMFNMLVPITLLTMKAM